MTLYLARRGNTQIFLSDNDTLENYFSWGCDIYRRDDSGDTLIATNGEWLEPKPDIEQHNEFTFEMPSELESKVRQMGADLDYISMMTGVSL